MFKRFFTKLNERGSLMVEAMAMLGLIAMVTPILYKKASERTTELQDINAASEMRALIKGIDDYLKDNYSAVINGETVVRETTDSSKSSFDYSNFATGTDKHVTVPIEHFQEYLPYGFLDSSGSAQASKTFSRYTVAVKKVAPAGENRKKTLTGFVFAEPRDVSRFQVLRSSRIASMIGSNGGYAYTANNATGVQGVWQVDNTPANLGVAAAQGTIIAASIQPISASAAGDLEDVLYRKWHNNDQKYNTMEVTLFMGRHRIEDINQMIVVADSPNTNDWHQDTDEDSALLIENGGGATISGRIMAAGEKFLVNADQLRYGEEDAVDGVTGTIINIDDDEIKIGVDKTMIEIETGNYESRGELIVDGDSLFGDKGDKGEGKYEDSTGVYKLTIRGNAFVDGILKVTALVADEVNTGILRAGTIEDNIEKRDEEYYALYASPDYVHVGMRTTDGNRYPIEVYNDNDIRLNLGDDSATFIAYGAQNEQRIRLDHTANTFFTKAAAGTRGTLIEQSNDGSDVFIDIRTIGNTANTDVDAQWVKLDYTETEVKIGTNYDTSFMNEFIVNRDGFFFDLLQENKTHLGLYREGVVAAGSQNELILEDDVNFRVLQNNVGILHVASNPTTADKNAYYNKTLEGDQHKGSVYIAKGVLEVGDQERDGVDPVFRVSGYHPGDGNDNKLKGTVNVRRGIIQVESNHTGADLYEDESDDSRGYIQVDRIIDNRLLSAGVAIPKDDGAVKYDSYQVNPAYTSVMHDIKLTTRGGARLSDILPDFINKGIYIVDSNYKENSVGAWNKGSVTVSDSGVVSIAAGTLNESSHGCDKYDCNTSAWLGFVPKPVCPPGYARVITITPAGWAMAQAGYPKKVSGSEHDVEQYFWPRNPDEYAEDDFMYPVPLYYQKSTWLKSNVVPYPKAAGGTSFKGWHAVMGFIYPYNFYKDYLISIGQGDSGATDKTVVWNIFPVKRKELEGYATVYCYFDRLDSVYDASYVDKYNQLGGYRQDEKKSSGYINRLNDPSSFKKYDTSW